MGALSEQYIQDWLKTYGEERTRRVFYSGLKAFMEYLYNVKFKNGVDESLEAYAASYLRECRDGKRDWFKDLLGFAAYLHDRPPKTAHTYLGAVKNWIEFSLDVELTRKQSKLLRGRLPKGNKARTEEDELSREKLRRLLSHMPLHGKALFLLLASSGIRISEALSLKLDDLDLNSDPVIVRVRGEYTKAGDAYYSFISKEAREILVEWLKQRDKYLEAAVNRGRGLAKLGRGMKQPSDDRVFPFSVKTAEAIWINALRKAELESRDKSTGRRTLHIHMLRKFFQSQMKYAGVPEDIVEALIGHSGYLDEAYRRYSREQMAEWYKKGEPYLLVNVPREIAEIQTHFQNEVEELHRRVEDLTKKLTDANAVNLQLLSENMKLKEKMARLESEIKELRRLFESIK
ncbi:MAG: tyrosine-type recombinase/integrase [Candidatus Bathyarchaeia archaeon]